MFDTHTVILPYLINTHTHTQTDERIHFSANFKKSRSQKIWAAPGGTIQLKTIFTLVSIISPLFALYKVLFESVNKMMAFVIFIRVLKKVKKVQETRKLNMASATS